MASYPLVITLPASITMRRWISLVALALLVLAPLDSTRSQGTLPPVSRTNDTLPYLVVACGDAGQTCCQPPEPIEGFAELGPMVNCKDGLGCDLATNTCVSPCGTAGQVCCDGPATRAPRWTTDNRIYVPAGQFTREMCEGSYCDRSDRRCKADCGQQAGQACCPPQPGVGVGTCLTTDAVCDRVETSFAPHGTCQGCGRLAQPACAHGCVDRSIEVNGACAQCGYPDMPVCRVGDPCDAGATPHPDHGITCVLAGSDGQPCLTGGLCNDGHECDEQNVCRACGQFDQPVCSGTQCRQGIPDGGFCRACGEEGQLCCRGYVELCRNGMQCRDNTCLVPGTATPSEGPRTCGGEPYTFATRWITVFYEDENSCGLALEAPANSEEEALQCARDLVGDRVIGLEGVMHSVYLSCPGTGCNSRKYLARDQESAEACAEATERQCEVTDQACE